MTRLLKLSAVLAIAVGSMMPTVETADAQRWNSVGRCYDSVEGVGTGRGVLGLGTARARSAARADWQARAASLYGPAYARISMARSVQWDCKRNAVLLAKCVVIAKPCGARIRG